MRLEHLSVDDEKPATAGSPTARRRAARGSGSKRQVRPGVWKLSVSAGTYPDGSQRRTSRTFAARNAAAATRELAAFVAEIEAGPRTGTRDLTKLTMDEAVELFLNDALLDAGCVWVDPIASLPPFITDRAPRPGDDRFRFVTGRRPVVEAAFARAAEQHPNVTVRRGASVVGLGAAASGADGVPHVNGVRLGTGEELPGDLVVDAMGRRTKLAEWLDDLGARPPYIESEDSGFVYHTRYFRGPEQPATIGPVLAPYGTMSVLTLSGDNNTWSATVWPHRRTPRFEDSEIRSASPRWLAPVPFKLTGSRADFRYRSDGRDPRSLPPVRRRRPPGRDRCRSRSATRGPARTPRPGGD